MSRTLPFFQYSVAYGRCFLMHHHCISPTAQKYWELGAISLQYLAAYWKSLWALPCLRRALSSLCVLPITGGDFETFVLDLYCSSTILGKNIVNIEERFLHGELVFGGLWICGYPYTKGSNVRKHCGYRGIELNRISRTFRVLNILKTLLFGILS